MATTLLPPLPGPPTWPEPAILTGHLAPASLVKYHQAQRAYLAFCATPAQALQATSLARWRTHLAQHTTLSPHTINRLLASVKRLVKEAAAQGYVDIVTAAAFASVAGVKPQALKDRLKTTTRTRLTPGQMRLLCDAPDPQTLRGRRDRALLATLASSGCRVSEVVTLTAAQIASRTGRFVLQVLGKNQTAPREAPLSQEAYMLIEAWLARRPVASDSLFTSFAGRGARATATPMSAAAVWQAVQQYAAAVGLRHVKPHDFRRFVGTELAKRDIRQAQKALGHTRIETTAKHYVLDELEVGLTDGLY
jgi:integrase/recombinase XerD